MDGNAFPADALVVEGTFGNAQTGKRWHSVSVGGLEPETVYVYQVSAGNAAHSETYTFKTGNPDAFSFFAVGDIQIGSSGDWEKDTAGWVNTMNIMTGMFPDTSFILSAGDQVEVAGYTHEYVGLLTPGQLANYPFAPVVGNHDMNSPLFNYHFNIPNMVSYGAGPTDFNYYYSYGDMLIIVLNSNFINIANHMPTIEAALASHPDAVWKVVTFHHAPYSVYRSDTDATKTAIVANWLPVFDEMGIDVVINGHCHSYSRSHHMKDNVPQLDQTWLDETKNIVQDPIGIVYFALNSASGSKYYVVSGAPRSHTAFYNQADRPNFSVASVTAGSFSLTTYQANEDGSTTIIDEYTIIKTSDVMPGEYTVTFVDWDGTVHDEQIVEQGKNATAPIDPEREGYTFIGWDVDFTVVSSDLTVTAMYEINTYTVQFMNWDGTVHDEQIVEHGDAAAAPSDPEREGHTFIGWDTVFTSVKSDLMITAQFTLNTAVILVSASTSESDFVSIVETSKNSNVWVLTFRVMETYSDGTTEVVAHAIQIRANNANVDGRHTFADSALKGYTLVYDIKGNGSNIKEFRLVK
jgi:hypothetical protein